MARKTKNIAGAILVLSSHGFLMNQNSSRLPVTINPVTGESEVEVGKTRVNVAKEVFEAFSNPPKKVDKNHKLEFLDKNPQNCEFSNLKLTRLFIEERREREIDPIVVSEIYAMHEKGSKKKQIIDTIKKSFKVDVSDELFKKLMVDYQVNFDHASQKPEPKKEVTIEAADPLDETKSDEAVDFVLSDTLTLGEEKIE